MVQFNQKAECLEDTLVRLNNQVLGGEVFLTIVKEKGIELAEAELDLLKAKAALCKSRLDLRRVMQECEARSDSKLSSMVATQSLVE